MREYLLLAEERAQFADGRLGRNRDDVGPWRHDFANERTAEVDDRLQERAFFALDQIWLVTVLDAICRFPVALVRDAAICRDFALTPAVDNQAHQRSGERVEEAGGEIERRQQDLERLLRVLADDEERQHVLEEQHEHGDAQQQHPDRREAFRSREHGEDDRRQRKNQPEHQACRDKELNRIVEIEADAIVAAAALDHQAQRQPHQRGERGLDRPDIDCGERQQQQEGDHRLARSVCRRGDVRSMRPLVSPPFLRSDISRRPIRPSSAAWW